MRVYRRERAAGRRWKLAILTGLLAFVIAIAAMTLPELVAGRSVVTGRITRRSSAAAARRRPGPRRRDRQKRTTTGDKTTRTGTQSQGTTTQPDTTTTAPNGQTTTQPPAQTQSGTDRDAAAGGTDSASGPDAAPGGDPAPRRRRRTWG